MAEERCECEAQAVLVFACSGASNVGQIANAAAVELMRQGRARMYCLAGMGAHISGMVDSAAHVDYRIALDGCAVACARKTLECAGLKVDKAVVVTELGIEKNHEFEWSYNDLDRVMEATTAGAPVMAGAEGCDCGCK
jgi:uncharacterized metal-binding protein